MIANLIPTNYREASAKFTALVDEAQETPCVVLYTHPNGAQWRLVSNENGSFTLYHVAADGYTFTERDTFSA